MEVWNNVFTQFDNDGEGHYTELAQKTIDTLIALRQHLADVTGLPTTLSQTGKVQPSDFEAVANTALNDGAIIVNPAEADFDEIVGILKEVWA